MRLCFALAITAAAMWLPAWSTAQCAEYEPEILVQRWGISDTHAPVAYHAATKRLLSTRAGSIVLWDLASGLPVRGFSVPRVDQPHVKTLDLCPDASRFLLGGSPELTLRETESGRVLVELPLADTLLRDAEISPDGRLAAESLRELARPRGQDLPPAAGSAGESPRWLS